MTDEQMDARLRDAGARWRQATPVPTLAPADRAEVEIERSAPPHRRRTWLAALTGAAVVVAAVAIGVAITRGDTPRPAGQAELDGTSWQLVVEVGASGSSPLPATEGIKGATLTFTTDGKVSGSDGCNLFSGPVDIGTDTLHFGNLARTEMACPATAAPADLIDRVFVGDVHWTMSAGKLVLNKPGVGSVTYAPKAAPTTSIHPKDLVGVTWGLSGVEHVSGNASSGSGSSDNSVITLTFDGRGSYALKGPDCWKESGRAALASGGAEFSGRKVTANLCPSTGEHPDLTVADKVLTGSTTWSITDGTLTIAKGGTKLTFTGRPATTTRSALIGTTWLLSEVTSPKLHQSLDTRKTKLKLTIDQRGSLSVDDGVNFHSVPNDKPVGITADTITLTDLYTTLAGCAGANELCTRAQVVSDVFAGTIGWVIQNGHLELMKGDTTLTYVRA